MRKVAKRPIKIRKRWAINPKTRIKRSARNYSRSRTKKEIRKLYKPRTFSEEDAGLWEEGAG